MSQPIFPVPERAQSPGASDIKWYAGLAMQAIIVKQESVTDTPVEREEIALWAWRMGQAMAAMEDTIQPEK